MAKQREGRPGHTHTHAHVKTRIYRDTHANTTHTHTTTHAEPLFLHSLRTEGGKPYQVISVKIDDDSIMVQILSYPGLAWTSIQNSHQPLEGHPACYGVPAGVHAGHEKVA